MKKRLYVEGMHCENCAKGLKSILEEDLKGIEVINIDVKNGYADVEMNDECLYDDISKAVSELDFELKKIDEL